MPPPWTSALCELYGPKGPEGGWAIDRDEPYTAADIPELLGLIWRDARYERAVLRLGEDNGVLVICVFHGGALPRGKFKAGVDVALPVRCRARNAANALRTRLR